MSTLCFIYHIEFVMKKVYSNIYSIIQITLVLFPFFTSFISNLSTFLYTEHINLYPSPTQKPLANLPTSHIYLATSSFLSKVSVLITQFPLSCESIWVLTIEFVAELDLTLGMPSWQARATWEHIEHILHTSLSLSLSPSLSLWQS